MNADHSDYVALLRKLRKIPGVKKVFVRSGIRFDYLLADSKDTFFRELVQYHMSGAASILTTFPLPMTGIWRCCGMFP